MKKTVLRFVLVFGIAALFSSCFSIPKTHNMVLDQQNPSNQNVTVTLENRSAGGAFFPLKWNDSEIGYKKSISSIDTIILTVPAGNNSFLLNVWFTISSRIYEKNNIELRYFLQQGKKYKIKGRSNSLGVFKGYEFFIGIYDDTGSSSELLKEWKIGEV